MKMRKEKIKYVVLSLWILFSILEQITENPFWGSLSECASYILNF